MRIPWKKVGVFVISEDGPTVTEYAVMLALIVFVCFAAIMLIGQKISATFSTLDAGLPSGT